MMCIAVIIMRQSVIKFSFKISVFFFYDYMISLLKKMKLKNIDFYHIIKQSGSICLLQKSLIFNKILRRVLTLPQLVLSVFFSAIFLSLLT